MDLSELCKHIVVTGKVQGVGFRNFTQFKAQKYKIKGWCRNLYTKEVEIFAQGNQENMIQFLSSVSKGPPFSRVDSFQEKSIELKESWELNEFEIKPDGVKPCIID